MVVRWSWVWNTGLEDHGISLVQIFALSTKAYLVPPSSVDAHQKPIGKAPHGGSGGGATYLDGIRPRGGLGAFFRRIGGPRNFVIVYIPYGALREKKKPTMRTTTSKPMLATITSRYHYLGGGIEGPNVSGGRPIWGAAGNAGRGGQR